jgi:hypothetical protein
MDNLQRLDDLIIKIFDDKSYITNKKEALIFNFLQTTRTCYLNMYRSSQIFLKYIEQEKKSSIARGKDLMTSREYLFDCVSPSIDARMNYFLFVEELNRFGRIFWKEYNLIIPKYYRISFYRNKMVEHCDEYIEFSNSMGNGLMTQEDKLVVVHHHGAILDPRERTNAYNTLHAEFQKYHINLPRINLLHTYDQYGELIYDYLEKIDVKLKEIKPELVNALFKFAFPNPIDDLEQYLGDLILWVNNIKSQA